MNYDSDVFREWDGKYCPLANIHKFENPHEPITKVGPLNHISKSLIKTN